MTKYTLTVTRTVTIVNAVEVEADNEQAARTEFTTIVKNGDLDEVSWGECWFYQVDKRIPELCEFEIIEVNLCSTSTGETS